MKFLPGHIKKLPALPGFVEINSVVIAQCDWEFTSGDLVIPTGTQLWWDGEWFTCSTLAEITEKAALLWVRWNLVGNTTPTCVHLTGDDGLDIKVYSRAFMGHTVYWEVSGAAGYSKASGWGDMSGDWVFAIDGVLKEINSTQTSN